MARKNEAHELVLQCLTQALLQLMEKKPFNEINVSELCDKAGVSRISFYRNFSSMPDILVRYLSKCTDDWWTEFIKRSETEFHETFWTELLSQYKKNEKLIQLIIKNDMSNIIKDHIFYCCGPQDGQNTQEQFVRAALAGAIYGLVEQWIKTGMKDVPESVSIKKMIEMANEYGVSGDE